jgi:hypothetical protein
MSTTDPLTDSHSDSRLALWGQVSSGDQHQFRFIRELSPQELSELGSAEELLLHFAAGSPIEPLSNCVDVYNDAYAHQARVPSASSLERVISSVSEFAAATFSVLERYGDLLALAPEIDTIMGTERMRVQHSPHQTYEELSELSTLLTATVRDKSVGWELSPVGLLGHIGPQPMKISELMLETLERVETLFLWEVNQLAKELDAACLYVRRLVAEVLQGVPVILPMSTGIGTMTPRRIEIDTADYVQTLRRHAEVAALAEQQPIESRPPDRTVAGTTEDPTPASTAQVDQQHGVGDPIPQPEPSLRNLVEQLINGLEDFLTAWSLALQQADVARDQAALKGAVTAIGTAAIRELSKDDGSNSLLLGYPLESDVVAALDVSTLEGRLALGGLGRVLITRQMLTAADSVASIRTLEVRGDSVRATSFHPGVAENAIALAWTLNSCVREDGLPTTDQWLNLAVQAHAWGMYEAAVLYALFHIGGTDVGHVLGPLARELLELAAGGDAAPSRACFAPIAGPVVGGPHPSGVQRWSLTGRETHLVRRHSRPPQSLGGRPGV